MTTAIDEADLHDYSRQAIILWCVLFILVVLLNGTIPFILGVDLHAWTGSPLKSVLFGFVFYALLFMAVPLVLIKGWETASQPAFLYPLCLAMLAISVGHFFHWVVAIAIIVLAYLHRRYDLSGYGIRSRGWKGDMLAVLLMGMLGFFPVLMRASTSSHSVVLGTAFLTGLDRLFANPASSVENLFYFGFLAERLSYLVGQWLTPPLIGLMYTAHEISNPEYWYGGMNFVLIFVGVTIWTAIYLWRRGVIAIWLGDGFYRFVGRLF
jgi:hypothetical protein